MKSILSLFLLFPLCILAHPIKMSLVHIQYNPETESVSIECRVFGDDLVLAIQEETSHKIKISNWNMEEEETVNSFMQNHVEVRFGKKLLNLDYTDIDYNASNNVISFFYRFSSISIKSGDKVSMKNDLFFKQFDFAQTNIFQLEIPQIHESNITCDKNNYSKEFIIK